MWIVKLALDRPYTFIVVSILILFLGASSIMTMPTDIFPNIDIPVITVVYDYRGLQAQEMEQRITTFSEFIMSTVNDVKSIDSQTVRGYAVLMIYFQPQVHIDAAIAQVGAAVQSIRFRFPAGVNPPWVLRFSASTVPIYQLALSSDTLSQSELYDYGIFRIRQKISVIPGTLLSAPHGGVVRQIMVDLNQQALLAKGLILPFALAMARGWVWKRCRWCLRQCRRFAHRASPADSKHQAMLRRNRSSAHIGPMNGRAGSELPTCPAP